MNFQQPPSEGEFALRPSTAGEIVSDPLAIKKALAQNFAKKILNSNKLISDETKKSTTELRNKFRPCLAKIYDNAT